MTKEQQIEKYIIEIHKCKTDFEYFCKHYVILNLPGKQVLMNPYDKQLELIEKVEDNKFVLVLKSRQIGISTILQAYAAWLCVFYKNVVIGLISKDAPEATDFARFIIGIIEELPIWMKPKFTKKTERTFRLSNGSKCYATPVAPNAPDKTLRGKAVTFLIIDEAAFIKFIDEAWTSMISTLSTNQMQAKKNDVPYGTVILSTPNKTVGVGKWFFDKYSKAISEDYIFKPFVIHWRDINVLANDPLWYKTQCELADNDPKKINQELELKFVSTSGTFFPEDIVIYLQEDRKIPYKELRLFSGSVYEFCPPQSGKFYLIGVDTASEYASDKSAITIWDYETLEQVWEFLGKLPIPDFIKVVKSAAYQYRNSLIIVENTGGYGGEVLSGLNADNEIANQIYRENRGKDVKLGLSTTGKSRPLMIDALYSYVVKYPEIVKSKRLALELVGLIEKNNGRVEADTGMNDDLALSTSFCFYVRKYDPPTMINMTQSPEQIHNLSDVINLNDGLYQTRTMNESITKVVKQDNLNGFINTLDLFNME